MRCDIVIYLFRELTSQINRALKHNHDVNIIGEMYIEIDCSGTKQKLTTYMDYQIHAVWIIVFIYDYVYYLSVTISHLEFQEQNF